MTPSVLLLLASVLLLLSDSVRVHSLSASPSKQGGGIVRVSVQRTLPGVAPHEARDAWLSYQWRGGGGLPGVFVWPAERRREGDGEDEDTGKVSTRRVVAPLFFEEELLSPDFEPADEGADANPDEGGERVVRYSVTDLGPIMRADLVPGSHGAAVCFAPVGSGPGSGGGCAMSWDVEFETMRRRRLWEAIARRTIADVSDNLASYVAAPLVYTLRVRLDGADCAGAAMEAWLAFVWDEGGGLLLPPIFVGKRQGGDYGDRTRARLVVPPFLKEELLSVDKSKNEIKYRISNPGPWSFYPAHSHFGLVRFLDLENGGVDMMWNVEVQPYHNFKHFVQGITSFFITTVAQNLRVRIEEPGSVVTVVGPRGVGSKIAAIPKETWLGGVLDAHLSDKRSVWEQTVSMFQPWTWGRGGVGAKGFVVEEWSEG